MIPGLPFEYLAIVLVVVMMSFMVYMYLFVKARPIKAIYWKEKGEGKLFNAKDSLRGGFVKLMKGKKTLLTVNKEAPARLLHIGGARSWLVYNVCERWPKTVEIWDTVNRTKENDLEYATTALTHVETESTADLVEGTRVDAYRNTRKELMSILTGVGLGSMGTFILMMVIGRI